MVRNTPKNAEPTAKAKLPPFVRGLLCIGTVLLAGLAGPVGLAAAFFGFLLSLVSTEALGVPYLAPHPFPQQPLSEDGVLRRNYRQLSRQGFNIWQKRERGKRRS